MSYQILALKWRPKTFADVIGQKYVVTALANSLSLGRVHQAYLFSGIRGVGKTSIARLLAKGLNCKTGITPIPCGICDNCNEIENGRFVDLIEIDAASRTKVEDTRDLLDNVQYAPVNGRFKVYLIDEVHMLSRYSFNALLKTLEEPPSHVKFLLATTDPQKLPLTILSRCLQFHLKTINLEQIRRYLETILDREQIKYENQALNLLAHAADGSLRDALRLTDQAIISGDGKLSIETINNMLGILDQDYTLSLIEAIIKIDGKRVIELVEDISSYGVEWETLLMEMQNLLHTIAMIQISPFSLIEIKTSIESRIRDLACTVSPTDIQLYYQILLIGRKELPFAPNKRMGVEMTLLRALDFHPKVSILEQNVQEQNLPSFTHDPSITDHQVSPYQGSDLFCSETSLSRVTGQILSARKQLHQEKEMRKLKKSKLLNLDKTKTEINDAVLEHLSSVTKRVHSKLTSSNLQEDSLKKKESLYKSTLILKK